MKTRDDRVSWWQETRVAMDTPPFRERHPQAQDTAATSAKSLRD